MEPVACLPVIEIAGDCRVLIEHHKGVCEYTQDYICVKVGFGYVCIWGNHFEVSSMTSTQLIIRGSVQRVELIKEE